MARHLLDETAEFTLPTAGRHAAEEEPLELDLTQKFTPRDLRGKPRPQQRPR